MRMDAFKMILKKTQPELFFLLPELLQKLGYKKKNIIVGDKFIYAKGKLPVMLTCHLDTVHKTIPYEIYYDADEDVMWSPQGIGGDDRCGVFAILSLAEYKPHILFCCDEETTGAGADEAADKIPAPDVSYIIGLDRRGNNDCVFYDHDDANFEFHIQRYGWETAWGSFSDISTLCPAWGIAGVNLSVCFYNEHSSAEIVKYKELLGNIDRIALMLQDEVALKKRWKYNAAIKYQWKTTKEWEKYYDEYYLRHGGGTHHKTLMEYDETKRCVICDCELDEFTKDDNESDICRWCISDIMRKPNLYHEMFICEECGQVHSVRDMSTQFNRVCVDCGKEFIEAIERECGIEGERYDG